MKHKAKEFIPPVIYSKVKKGMHRDNISYNPKWHNIKGGNLKGRKIFIDPQVGYWIKELVDGNFDTFLINYLETLNLKGKVIFEIGAHIGYHTMNFAQFVGEQGSVHAFEPNKYNLERMRLILSENPELDKVITIHDIAISDSDGDVEFHFSPNIDSGDSSCGFIEEASTPQSDEEYVNLGFKKIKVRTICLDNMESLGICETPHLIKIDVEGAESLVIKGGLQMLNKYRPILVIEIHSVLNMLKTYELLNSIGYSIELLKEDDARRCFVVANP